MIQRNGRVNRLNSPFKKVFIYNISPENKLEQYLKLVKRLEQKINLIRNTIGTDAPVLNEEANPIEFNDNWEDIYSESEEKRIKALYEAEKQADFLLAEDEFLADLKKFHSSKEFSPEYKKLIYSIPFGKWGIMPNEKNRGEKRKDILILSQQEDEKQQFISHIFNAMDQDTKSFQAITNLQALEWLRTNSKNNTRLNDHIKIDKEKIKKISQERILKYKEELPSYSLKGQERQVLRILHEKQFSEEDIKKVNQAIQKQTQILQQKKLQSLIRKICQLYKKNNSSIESPLHKLIKKSHDILNSKEKKTDIKIHSSKQLLFYLKDISL